MLPSSNAPQGLITNEKGMDRQGVDVSAPSRGYCRRRSSILAAEVLDAIRETDDEIYEEMLQFDLLALGGGVAAGYWSQVRCPDFIS